MKNSIPQEKVTKLRKVYPKVKNTQKKYYLPIYLKRWKIYSIDKRDQNVKTIQDFLKNHVHQKTIIKKVITKQKKDNNLKTFVIKKSDNKDDRIRRILKKWFANARRITLNNEAKKIQKFLHKTNKKKQEVKQVNYDKIKKLIIKYLLRLIADSLHDINKSRTQLRKALGKIQGVDKDILNNKRNSLIDFAQDTIKRQVLSHVIKNISKIGGKDILRKYLIKWKDNKDQFLLKVRVLQNFVRK